jgi:hypothetical protein
MLPTRYKVCLGETVTGFRFVEEEKALCPRKMMYVITSEPRIGKQLESRISKEALRR